MPTNEKERLVAEIKGRLQGPGGVIMADYRGLSVKDMQTLRVRLRDAGGEITVYKNSLAQIAITELGLPSMDEFLEGPTAFVFTPVDPVTSAKALVDFAKEFKVLSVKGGLIEGRVVSAEQVKSIAALPSREELVSKLMGALLNPVRNFMAMANAPVGAFARTLRAVADQKAAA
jgi:large subunit ribosomal protein L10